MPPPRQAVATASPQAVAVVSPRCASFSPLLAAPFPLRPTLPRCAAPPDSSTSPSPCIQSFLIAAAADSFALGLICWCLLGYRLCAPPPPLAHRHPTTPASLVNVAEIRDSWKRAWVWLGTFDTAETAIQLRSPDATINFELPSDKDIEVLVEVAERLLKPPAMCKNSSPATSYNSGKESHVAAASSTSVRLSPPSTIGTADTVAKKSSPPSRLP